VTLAHAKIVEAVSSFSEGRRFHFVDPSGNELVVRLDRRGRPSDMRITLGGAARRAKA
jgi:hypothetical protein